MKRWRRRWLLIVSAVVVCLWWNVMTLTKENVLRFIRYEPSVFEQRSLAQHGNSPCLAMFVDKKLSKWNSQYIESLSRCCVPHQPLPYCTLPMVYDQPRYRLHPRVFSRMVFERHRGGQVEEVQISIEPLVGALRHPLVCQELIFGKNEHVLNKNYMVVDPYMLTMATGKVLMFDVGASTWADGAGGASQEFFYSLFKSLCRPVDEYHAWEATPLPSSVLDEIPMDLRDGYFWYNVAASSDSRSEDNPLNTVRRVSRREDYVVFKLDIDHGPTELRLIQQILLDRNLSDLIDELFFEHHAKFEPMVVFWGNTTLGDLHVSYELFTALRHRGIRAHSWV